MAIPNINQITSTLRMMGDSALQQYATMHKNDPYILPMAIAESNARKQVRSQAQAKMAMQPQPKVAEKEIAEMSAPIQLPEQQGIAQLPAPNIQTMAGGGIVAFADGGYAEGGMGSSEPVIRMAGGGETKKYSGATGESLVRTTNGGKSWWLDVPKTVRDPSVAWYRDIPNPLASLADKEFSSREEALQAYNSLAQPAASASTASPIIPYGQSKATNVLGDKPPAPPAPPPTPPMQQGLGSMPASKAISPEDAKKQAGMFSDFEESRTALKKASTDQETDAARMRTMLAEGLPTTPVMSGLTKLLDKQEAESGGEKEKAAGLALIMGGLAVAGGSSPHALQNLKEAIPAVSYYGDALKDLKKMERENLKLRGDIEIAQRAENTNNLKLKLDVDERINARRDKINDLGIQLTSKVADVDARTAMDIWKTSTDNVAREKAAGISALAGTQAQLNMFERLGSADPNSALRKGYSLTKQEGAEPKLYSEYIKNTLDPVAGAEFLRKYPTFEIYKEGYSAGSLQFAAPPASASILKPPKG